jgi:hypothetical protein
MSPLSTSWSRVSRVLDAIARVPKSGPNEVDLNFLRDAQRLQLCTFMSPPCNTKLYQFPKIQLQEEPSMTTSTAPSSPLLSLLRTDTKPYQVPQVLSREEQPMAPLPALGSPLLSPLRTDDGDVNMCKCSIAGCDDHLMKHRAARPAFRSHQQPLHLA